MKTAWAVWLLAVLGVCMFSESRAGRAVRFFEMLRHTDGQYYGQEFKLLGWQRKIVRDVYGTVNERGVRQFRYVYLEIPKKNGKSEMAAGAALYHLFADGERNGEVYGCAADRGQAGIVFDVAVDMIDQLPALKKRAKLAVSLREIRDRVSGTVYKVLSADAFRKHGFKVSACVFDELHAQPNRDLWDVMTFGAGDTRLQPMWWIITTAGDDPDRVSVCWEQHEYAQRLLAGDIYDPGWYPVVYGYEGEDIYNEANWAMANPSLGTTFTIDSLREAAARAMNRPADERLFRWLRLNQWITTKLTAWLPLELFDRTVGEWNRWELIGRECYLGMDLSSTTDLSALCLVFPPQGRQTDWRVIWECFIPAENMAERVRNDKVPYDVWAKAGWVTATEGNVVDYTVIEARINALRKIYRVREVCADRAMATMLLQRLEQQGLTCVDVPQTYIGLSDAMNQVEVLLGSTEGSTEGTDCTDEGTEGATEGTDCTDEGVEAGKGRLRRGRMTHEANPVARWCFGNTATAKNGQGYIKFVKEHKGGHVVRTKRIDLTAAWVNAMARARFYRGSVDISEDIMSGDWGL